MKGKGRGFSLLSTSSYDPLLGFETVRAKGRSRDVNTAGLSLRSEAKLVEMLVLGLSWR